MNTNFTARMQILINDTAFVAEHDYDTVGELRSSMDAMILSSGSPITLEAVLMCMELETHLDENSQAVLGRLLDAQGLVSESFFSEDAGSYDRFTNRVTAEDMGLVFPDGTLRTVWTRESSVDSLENSLNTLVQAVSLLADAQDLPYTADDDEDESAIWQNERTDILRGHGFVLQG